ENATSPSSGRASRSASWYSHTSSPAALGAMRASQATASASTLHAWVLALHLRFPRQQALNRRRRRQACLQHRRYRLGNGHLDAARFGKLRRFARRAHTLGDMPEVRDDVLERAAARELHADATVARQIAGRREDQVARASEA